MCIRDRLFSQGISLESLGISRLDGTPFEKDHRKIWQTFADYFYLFRGTPSRIWFEHALHEVLGIELPFNPENADVIYDEINEKLYQESFRPRALFDRFNLEVLATTESPLDELVHHRLIAESGWNGRVITAFRPDPVVDPEFEGFSENITLLGQLTGEDTTNWTGYLNALMQ